jgi:hypothetical protein
VRFGDTKLSRLKSGTAMVRPGSSPSRHTARKGTLKTRSAPHRLDQHRDPEQQKILAHVLPPGPLRRRDICKFNCVCTTNGRCGRPT